MIAKRPRSILRILKLAIAFIFKSYTSKVINSILIGVAAIVSESLSIVLILSFLRLLEQKDSLVLTENLSLSFTPLTFFLFVALILAMMLIGGLFSYKARSLRIEIFSEYQTHCIKNFLGLMGGAIEPRTEYIIDPSGKRIITKMSRQTARRAGMAITALFNGIDNILRASVFGVIALYLETSATLLVFLMGGVILYWQYITSKDIHNSDLNLKRYEKKNGAVLDRFTKMQIYRFPSPEHDESLSSNLLKDESISGSITSLANVLRLNAFSGLIGHILYSIGIIAALGFVLIRYQTGKISIPEIIVYIYALRLFLLSTKGTIGVIGNLSRHYRFLRDAVLFLEYTPGRERKADNISLPVINIEDQRGTLGILNAGETWIVYSPIKISRFNSNFITYPILKNLDPNKMKDISLAVLSRELLKSKEHSFQTITGFDSPDELIKRVESYNDLEPIISAWKRIADHIPYEFEASKPLIQQINKPIKVGEHISALSMARLLSKPVQIAIIEYELLELNSSLIQLIENSFPETLKLILLNKSPDNYTIKISGCISLDFSGINTIDSGDNLSGLIESANKSIEKQRLGYHRIEGAGRELLEDDDL